MKTSTKVLTAVIALVAGASAAPVAASVNHHPASERGLLVSFTPVSATAQCKHGARLKINMTFVNGGKPSNQVIVHGGKLEPDTRYAVVVSVTSDMSASGTSFTARTDKGGRFTYTAEGFSGFETAKATVDPKNGDGSEHCFLTVTGQVVAPA